MIDREELRSVAERADHGCCIVSRAWLRQVLKELALLDMHRAERKRRRREVR
jgi:hypothetical protein